MGARNLKVLVVNSGSSSLKFSVLETPDGAVLANGMVERLQTDDARLEVSVPEKLRREETLGRASHREALRRIIRFLTDEAGVAVDAIGHRVVHGGESFRSATRIDRGVLDRIQALSALAPLHNPPGVEGVKLTLEMFPGRPQVAVFDTAFHAHLAPEVYHYALPYELYETHRIRRYGFHGISYAYILGETARRLGSAVDDLQFIAAHLGNGCSAAAIRDGRSVDTTMGLTPLEGLVMGTRSGDVDPSLPYILHGLNGVDLPAINDTLNKKSGLLGLSGVSSDLRQVRNAIGHGNRRAQLAFDVFCFRLARAILALTAGLSRVDAVVFTGGIGEHSPEVRADVLRRLTLFGSVVDDGLNGSHGAAADGRITRAGVPAYVIPTNEELTIARETAALVG